jgi:hypothetical protein
MLQLLPEVCDLLTRLPLLLFPERLWELQDHNMTGLVHIYNACRQHDTALKHTSSACIAQ